MKYRLIREKEYSSSCKEVDLKEGEKRSMTWYYSINTRHSNDNLISVSPAAASSTVDHVTGIFYVILDKPAGHLSGYSRLYFSLSPQNLAAGISDFTSRFPSSV